jgi:hypothetical protein
MQPESVRHCHSSIDYDFYRRRAEQLREQQIRNFVQRASVMLRRLLAVVFRLGALPAMPRRRPETMSRPGDARAARSSVGSRAN